MPRPITLLNAHADDLIKTPVSFWLARRRGLEKYAYLIDEAARSGERVNVLVDGTLSSLLGQTWFSALPGFLRRLALTVEISVWLKINDLSDKVQIHWSTESIPDRSVLYLFSYKNCVGAFEQRKPLIEKFRTKIINLSHYFIRTTEKAANIAKLDGVMLTTESDIRSNTYFRKHFPEAPPLIVMPFAAHPRFRVTKPLAERRGLCAATGSFHNLRSETPAAYYRDFITFFDSDTYHPVRKLLFEHRDETKGWLDIRISKYREKGDTGAAPLTRFDVAQTTYFSFDIVEFYNDHQFAIVGEELSGAPTIGFFEAMSCGCIMLGQRGNFYDGLGLEPDVHYLPHDGTIESIHGAIQKVLNDPGRKARLSEAGLAYVAAHCTPTAIWTALQRQLETRKVSQP